MRLQGDMSGRGMRRGGRRFVGLLAAVMMASMLVVAGCGGDDDAGGGAAGGQASEPMKVRIAFTPGFGTLPVQIAREKGYFEANGLDVEATEGLDLAVWVSALDKQFDIVMTLPPVLLQAASRGAPLTAISNMQVTDPEHLNNVLVTADPAIKSAADLRGKKVGVPSLTGGSATAMRYLVQDAGGEVKLVQTPFDTMADQLKAGRIDAAVSAIPFYTAQKAAGLHIHDDVFIEAAKLATDGASDSVSTALFITSPSFAQENPEVVEAWRKSLQQAIDFMESNEAEAREILQAWLKLPPEIAQEAPLPAVAVDLPAEHIEPFAEMLEATGELKNAPNVDELIYQGQ